MKKFMKNLLLVLLLIALIYVFYNFIFAKYRNKNQFEKESITLSQSIQDAPFFISKIILYHSAYGKNQNTTFEKSSWILNLLQYSDIAIYLEHSEENLTSANTVKKLFLEDIEVSSPKLGSGSLYYLDSLNFGTPTFNNTYKLDHSLEFTVLNDENENNNIQSNTPVFFTDCSNPITLKYVNPSVKENYGIASKEPIFFDGRLLKMANITREDLEVTIDFTIHIQNHDNVDYFYYLNLPIRLEDDSSSIYDGSLLVEKSFENYKFIKEF